MPRYSPSARCLRGTKRVWQSSRFASELACRRTRMKSAQRQSVAEARVSLIRSPAPALQMLSQPVLR